MRIPEKRARIPKQTAAETLKRAINTDTITRFNLETVVIPAPPGSDLANPRLSNARNSHRRVLAAL
jgi:hypothetical protein